jgi:hypothetical protein
VSERRSRLTKLAVVSFALECSFSFTFLLLLVSYIIQIHVAFMKNNYAFLFKPSTVARHRDAKTNVANVFNYKVLVKTNYITQHR